MFERRKMGHVTALGATPEEALARAREAAGQIGWAPADEGSPTEPGEPREPAESAEPAEPAEPSR